jgi:hypothetical protein
MLQCQHFCIHFFDFLQFKIMYIVHVQCVYMYCTLHIQPAFILHCICVPFKYIMAIYTMYNCDAGTSYNEIFILKWKLIGQHTRNHVLYGRAPLV